MREASERAKIVPPISFHILRHCYASLLVKSGAALHMIAKNLGHCSRDGQPDTRMLLRHYGHIEDSHIAKTIREHAPTFDFPKSNVELIRG